MAAAANVLRPTSDLDRTSCIAPRALSASAGLVGWSNGARARVNDSRLTGMGRARSKSCCAFGSRSCHCLKSWSALLITMSSSDTGVRLRTQKTLKSNCKPEKCPGPLRSLSQSNHACAGAGRSRSRTQASKVSFERSHQRSSRQQMMRRTYFGAATSREDVLRVIPRRSRPGSFLFTVRLRGGVSAGTEQQEIVAPARRGCSTSRRPIPRAARSRACARRADGTESPGAAATRSSTAAPLARMTRLIGSPFRAASCITGYQSDQCRR